MFKKLKEKLNQSKNNNKTIYNGETISSEEYDRVVGKVQTLERENTELLQEIRDLRFELKILHSAMLDDKFPQSKIIKNEKIIYEK